MPDEDAATDRLLRFPRSAMHSAKDVVNGNETVSTVLDTCVPE